MALRALLAEHPDGAAGQRAPGHEHLGTEPDVPLLNDIARAGSQAHPGVELITKARVDHRRGQERPSHAQSREHAVPDPGRGIAWAPAELWRICDLTDQSRG